MSELTKEEAAAVAELIETNLLEVIRNDTDIDNLHWLRTVIHAYEKLCVIGENVGLYEEGKL